MACFILSYRNLLDILLYALASNGQMRIIEIFYFQPQIILMIFDSVALLMLVFLEDISIKLNLKQSEMIHSTFKRENRKMTRIKAKNHTEHFNRRKYTVIALIVLCILTVIINSWSFFLYLNILCGIGGLLFCFNIPLSWLLLHFLSHSKIYRHHVLALSLFLVGLIANVILYYGMYYGLFVMLNGIWVFIGCSLGVIVTVSAREVIEKYALENLYIKHFRLLFYEGVGSLIGTLLLLGMIQFFDCFKVFGKQFNLVSFCRNSQPSILGPAIFDIFGYVSLHTLYIWLYLIVGVLANVFRVMLNKRYGPTHRYAGDLLAYIFFMITQNISDMNSQGKLFDWALYCVMAVLLIGCLIYNENIRIALCGLASNTRKEIHKRAKEESTLDEMALFDLKVDDDSENSGAKFF